MKSSTGNHSINWTITLSSFRLCSEEISFIDFDCIEQILWVWKKWKTNYNTNKKYKHNTKQIKQEQSKSTLNGTHYLHCINKCQNVCVNLSIEPFIIHRLLSDNKSNYGRIHTHTEFYAYFWIEQIYFLFQNVNVQYNNAHAICTCSFFFADIRFIEYQMQSTQSKTKQQ